MNKKFWICKTYYDYGSGIYFFAETKEQVESMVTESLSHLLSDEGTFQDLFQAKWCDKSIEVEASEILVDYLIQLGVG